MTGFRTWLESSALESLISDIIAGHPGMRMDAYETREKIELTSIEVPEGSRGSGIGTKAVKRLQDYARMVGKPIVLRPEAEKGRKGDLERFYKSLGFVHNKGRNTDFVLSSPTSRSMYWRPPQDVVEQFDLDSLESFYRDNEQKVLNHPEVKKQLKDTFQVDGRLIRKILGIGEEGRSNYFIRTFNQRHGDLDKHLRLGQAWWKGDSRQNDMGRSTISKEMLSWFSGSKITEKDGSPKIVYHGTTEKFDKFEAGEFGFHFGDENAAGMMGNTQKFILRIVNPLRLKDLGVWEPERVLKEFLRKFAVPEEIVRETLKKTIILGKNPDLDDEDDFVQSRKAHYAWSGPVRGLIKSLGYDGIVYRNEAEGFSDSYIAFDPDQIHRV